MLRNVFPRSAGINRHDGRLGHAELRPDVALSHATLRAQFTNDADLRFAQLRGWMLLALPRLPVLNQVTGRTSLLGTVAVVVGNRAGSQVCWVAARRVIAGVHHYMADGWRAVREVIGHAMGGQWGLDASGRIEPTQRTVAALTRGAAPRPALVWPVAFNALPEVRHELKQVALIPHAHSISPEMR